MRFNLWYGGNLSLLPFYLVTLGIVFDVEMRTFLKFKRMDGIFFSDAELNEMLAELIGGGCVKDGIVFFHNEVTHVPSVLQYLCRFEYSYEALVSRLSHHLPRDKDLV